MNKERGMFSNKSQEKPNDSSSKQLHVNDADNEHDCWASDSGSSSGSYYSDDDGSIVDWEASIKPSGDVFHIESLITTDVVEQKLDVDVTKSKSPTPELTRRRSTKGGKLLRLIRRRESRRQSMRNKKAAIGSNTQQKSTLGNAEVGLGDYEAGEIREAMLTVDPEKRHKLGRRATLCEAYLGIFPGVFTENSRVTVAGFIPDGQAARNKNIRIGDWLRTVDGQEVTLERLESFLSGIHEPANVKLEFQRRTGFEESSRSPEPTSPKEPQLYHRDQMIHFAEQSPMVHRLVSDENCNATMETLLKYPLGVIFLKTTGLSETGPEFQEVLYTFPRSPNTTVQSVVCCARGAFITLNHMLPNICSGPQPISTSVLYEGDLVHVTYTSRGEELLLIALPDKCCSLPETLEISADIVRALEFSYQTLSRCFTSKENHAALDHLFCLSFVRLFDPSDLLYPSDKCEFESILPAARSIKLPRDAQIQIDAALNEMEAMDYRDWNEDAMDCQRLYTILGSCLYHRGFLLGSHLPHQDLIEVHTFLRQRGLLNLISNEPVKSLIVWQRVYPFSCSRGSSMANNGQALVINGKWFVLVVGYGHQLLVVLLESGGCTAELEENPSPDIFYLEEAQETLKHVIKIGIPTLADKWIAANCGSGGVGILDDEATTKTVPTLAENLFGFMKSNEARSKSPNVNTIGNKRGQEVSSILKKSTLEQNPTFLGSVYSLHTSEDSVSQGTEAVSEVSDDAAPMLGRRATKERMNVASRQSDGSDSDMDSDRNESQSSMMNISDIRQNLLNQAESIIPKKLTAGTENHLFHYVHLDTLQGILLSSLENVTATKTAEILWLFNRRAHVVHKLLRNTMRFEKMLNQEAEKSVVNKSLIAIKEHGVLFEFDNMEFWVIGRLFTSPHPRELYVCYKDSVPQNLIEIAFRLNAM